jgi:hypothetical protein
LNKDISIEETLGQRVNNSIEALKKLKIDLLYDPAISLLGIYLQESVSAYNKDTCTPIFIAALFTITKL